MNPYSAGIYICFPLHSVVVAPHLVSNNIRKFSTFTTNLIEICNYLKNRKLESVCMESTGVYWITLYNLWKYGFEVFYAIQIKLIIFQVVRELTILTLPGFKNYSHKVCPLIHLFLNILFGFSLLDEAP